MQARRFLGLSPQRRGEVERDREDDAALHAANLPLVHGIRAGS